MRDILEEPMWIIFVLEFFIFDVFSIPSPIRHINILINKFYFAWMTIPHISYILR